MILPELQQWLQTQTVYPKYPTELPDSSREFYGVPSREFILLESSNKLIVHYNATTKLIAPILPLIVGERSIAYTLDISHLRWNFRTKIECRPELLEDLRG